MPAVSAVCLLVLFLYCVQYRSGSRIETSPAVGWGGPIYFLERATVVVVVVVGWWLVVGGWLWVGGGVGW